MSKNWRDLKGPTKTLTKDISVTIAVYKKDPHCCSDRCPFLKDFPFLDSNQYYNHCLLFGGSEIDGSLKSVTTSTDYPAIKRCENCINQFGLNV